MHLTHQFIKKHKEIHKIYELATTQYSVFGIQLSIFYWEKNNTILSKAIDMEAMLCIDDRWFDIFENKETKC